MKKVIFLITFLTLFVFSSVPVRAASFFDNFSRLNTNKWDFSFTTYPGIPGNWRVENGTLVQDDGRDSRIARVKKLILADQMVETKLKINQNSYCGITLWFKDDYNWVNVRMYPGHNEIWVEEFVDNVMNFTRYPGVSGEQTWYRLKAIASSRTGRLDVFIDDAHYVTHYVKTTNRSGQSGLMSGNSGGYFDNFLLVGSKEKKNPK